MFLDVKAPEGFPFLLMVQINTSFKWKNRCKYKNTEQSGERRGSSSEGQKKLLFRLDKRGMHKLLPMEIIQWDNMHSSFRCHLGTCMTASTCLDLVW